MASQFDNRRFGGSARPSRLSGDSFGLRRCLTVPDHEHSPESKLGMRIAQTSCLDEIITVTKRERSEFLKE